MMKYKRYWVLYFVCLFLFVELSLQRFYRVTTGTYLYAREKPPLWASDPYSGWTNRPDFSYRHVTPEFAAEIYTNSEGFRVSSAHEEYQKTRPNNTFRILLLGPSFAFGWGVNFEATFGAQLQQILTARHFAEGSTIEVLNHGVPGLPAANELEWLKNVGRDYAPDLVIHFVYGSLEVSPTADSSWVVRSGHLIPVISNETASIWRYAKNSATVFYAGIVIVQTHKLMFGSFPANSIEGAGREMRNSASFSIEQPQVTQSLLYYRALKKMVEDMGASLLVVYFPLAYVVHPEDRLRWALQGVENIQGQIQFNGAFSSYLNRIGIRTLNLTEPFIKSATIDKERLYYWLDVHWTGLGNGVAARLVADHLNVQPIHARN